MSCYLCKLDKPTPFEGQICFDCMWEKTIDLDAVAKIDLIAVAKSQKLRKRKRRLKLLQPLDKHLPNRVKKHAYKKHLWKLDPTCSYCGRELTKKEATIDHIWPRYKGGPNTAENFCLACEECNTAKGADIFDINY